MSIVQLFDGFLYPGYISWDEEEESIGRGVYSMGYTTLEFVSGVFGC